MCEFKFKLYEWSSGAKKSQFSGILYKYVYIKFGKKIYNTQFFSLSLYLSLLKINFRKIRVAVVKVARILVCACIMGMCGLVSTLFQCWNFYCFCIKNSSPVRWTSHFIHKLGIFFALFAQQHNINFSLAGVCVWRLWTQYICTYICAPRHLIDVVWSQKEIVDPPTLFPISGSVSSLFWLIAFQRICALPVS